MGRLGEGPRCLRGDPEPRPLEERRRGDHDGEAPEEAVDAREVAQGIGQGLMGCSEAPSVPGGKAPKGCFVVPGSLAWCCCQLDEAAWPVPIPVAFPDASSTLVGSRAQWRALQVPQ